MKPAQTGEGYVYYRDRSGGEDVTVYEHQLVALLEHEPREVFDPAVDVHHTELRIPWANWPDNVSPEDAYEHRVGHLQGHDGPVKA